MQSSKSAKNPELMSMLEAARQRIKKKEKKNFPKATFNNIERYLGDDISKKYQELWEYKNNLFRTAFSVESILLSITQYFYGIYNLSRLFGALKVSSDTTGKMFLPKEMNELRKQLISKQLGLPSADELDKLIALLQEKLQNSNSENKEQVISAIQIVIETYNETARRFHFFCGTKKTEYHLQFNPSSNSSFIKI